MRIYEPDPGATGLHNACIPHCSMDSLQPNDQSKRSGHNLPTKTAAHLMDWGMASKLPACANEHWEQQH
jgi:hypothetical protein